MTGASPLLVYNYKSVLWINGVFWWHLANCVKIEKLNWDFFFQIKKVCSIYRRFSLISRPLYTWSTWARSVKQKNRNWTYDHLSPHRYCEIAKRKSILWSAANFITDFHGMNRFSSRIIANSLTTLDLNVLNMNNVEIEKHWWSINLRSRIELISREQY